jgi:hypothetical protein
VDDKDEDFTHRANRTMSASTRKAARRVRIASHCQFATHTLLLQKSGNEARARQLLDGAMKAIERSPRLGDFGVGLADVQIHALRGERDKALSALRQAGAAGWRGTSRFTWGWKYYRDFDPSLASIRNEPEFKAVFADIERDMARQRAALASNTAIDEPRKASQQGSVR